MSTPLWLYVVMVTDAQMTPERIKAIRKGLGLSQAEFGTRLGKTQNAVSWWERGGRTPSNYQTVIALLQAERDARKVKR